MIFREQLILRDNMNNVDKNLVFFKSRCVKRT